MPNLRPMKYTGWPKGKANPDCVYPKSGQQMRRDVLLATTSCLARDADLLPTQHLTELRVKGL